MDWITCGSLWCFYQLFRLSFWRHPFTAEDTLLSKWCNDTFLQIWWRNKLIYILDGLRGTTFTANFHFWVNCFLNNILMIHIKMNMLFNVLSFCLVSHSNRILLEKLREHNQPDFALTCPLPFTSALHNSWVVSIRCVALL